MSQIRQGSNESFQDFVSRLNTAAGRIFGPSVATQSFVTQLAYENANSACQAVLRPYRKKENLNDYIRLCADVGPSFTQGIAIAAAFQEKSIKEVLYQQGRIKAGCHSGACFTCKKKRGIELPNAQIKKKVKRQLLKNLQISALNVKKKNIGPMSANLKQIKMEIRFRETG